MREMDHHQEHQHPTHGPTSQQQLVVARNPTRTSMMMEQDETTVLNEDVEMQEQDDELLDVDITDEYTPLTPRYRNSSLDDDSSSTTTDQSSAIAAANNFLSFDDSGRVASYLQMFQQPPPPPQVQPKPHQPQRFELSYSADRRTKTPHCILPPGGGRALHSRTSTNQKMNTGSNEDNGDIDVLVADTGTNDGLSLIVPADPENDRYYGYVEDDFTSPMVGLQRPSSSDQNNGVRNNNTPRSIIKMMKEPSSAAATTTTRSHRMDSSPASPAAAAMALLYDDENMALDRGSLERSESLTTTTTTATDEDERVSLAPMTSPSSCYSTTSTASSSVHNLQHQHFHHAAYQNPYITNAPSHRRTSNDISLSTTSSSSYSLSQYSTTNSNSTENSLLFGESILQSVSTSLRSVFSFHGDLEYLKRQHETKMRELRQYHHHNDNQQQAFDFCLVLVPQQVYGFWAELLDFRVELLGQEVVDAMEAAWEHHHQNFTARTSNLLSPSSTTTSASGTTASSSIRRRKRNNSRPASPKPQCTTQQDDVPATTTSNKTSTSVFEKAMEGPAVTQTPFRRWGHQPNTSSMQSPPVRALYSAKMTPARTTLTSTTSATTASQQHPPQPLLPENNDEIPNPCIARGVAARENRTKGMMPLLYALKRGGVVLRHHHPNAPPTFCRLFSVDGGDTIQYVSVEPLEALRWLEDQQKQHGGDDIPDDWKKIADNSTRTAPVFYPRRSLKVADIVAVHPARNNDKAGLPGSVTLRKATSSFCPERTFSIVLKKLHHRTDREWHVSGKTSISSFKYFDLEAADITTYWKVFRGILLLHRDAIAGRFAKQRAAGLGRRSADAILHEDEFHEPATASWLERRLVQYYGLDDTYLKGFVTKPNATPPPSDYFLGFKSPGTAIWSRLRQAGLETRRLYSLDPNRVMIQVRCPSDRLMDVAEVLKIQIKTSEGNFTPFRTAMMETFVSKDTSSDMDDSPFRSSVRQTIIDFIIGSRIRDSGAELGQRTDLGSLILARVPLHSPQHLQGIFTAWFYFWRAEHWDEIQSSQQSYSLGRRRSKMDKLTVPQGFDDEEEDEDDDEEELGRAVAAVAPSFAVDNDESTPPPHALHRFVVGCFCQPLDAIEQYFGEKVAFYFTWLQHTAVHLVFLAVPGLIVFICMLCSGNFNHPLRPFFAVYVMMWTFIVLLNWKKRANYMAYRWGTMNYKEQETTRPQFKGDFVQDEITGEWIVRYPKWKRWIKYCISFPLTLLFTSGTLFLILWVHANRDWALAKYLTSDKIGTFKDFSPSAIGSKPVLDVNITREMLLTPQFWFIAVALPSMLGLFLPLLNFILMRLSILLNDFENYRTISEYRTFLIIKVFSFRFVCYFSTLYYYAYVSTIMTAEERLMDGADELRDERIRNGILRVGTGLCVYTTVAQWWQTFLQHCFPLLIRRLRMNHRLQRLADELRAVETEEDEIQRLAKAPDDGSLKQRRIKLINKRLLLDQAQDDVWLELMNPMHDSFPEYIQAVVQFAFVSCFSVVLPITPLLVLFNYLVSMRLDAYKLCKSRRRPLAEKTGGIGVWEHVLHIVAVISVLTNCWLVGFTSSFFVAIGKNIGDLGLFALIVAWEHIMLLIKYAMSTSASTIPKAVRDDMKRQQYDMEKKRSTLMLERRVKSPRVLTTEV